MSDDDVVAERLRELLDRFDGGEHATEFLARQFDLGLAWTWFPEGRGGLGARPDLQDVVDAELRRTGAPEPAETNAIGLTMAAPTLVRFGSEHLQERHLRRIFTGESVWCQLFSEPGSGSDLAGLATRADRVGDTWVLNGQKVWTSFANFADWALCLARSDPDVPKHRGLTYFVVDMHAPGVEVAPLREMTGDAQFSEVFLTDVHVPDDQRVGDVGDGWRASLGTLANERAGMGEAPLGSAAIDDVMAIWRAGSHDDGVQRDRLARYWSRSQVNTWLNMRAQQQRASGIPGAEGSIVKLAAAELSQELYAFGMELLGAEGMVLPGPYPNRRMQRGDRLLSGREFWWLVLRSRGFTVEGGTAQIQRNILAERVLGLPGDVRTDRDIPWKDVPRS